MKRILYLILFMCATLGSLSAQDATPLLSLLQSIESSQSAYTIDIVSDGLEELTTKADVTGLDAVAAVKRACKGLPVKVKVHGQHIYVQHERQKTVRRLSLRGEVQDIRAHKPLLGATVELLDADSIILEQKEARRKHFSEYGSWETSEFSFTVPARTAKYLFRISLEGYQTTYVAYSLDKIGRREHEHELPPFYLAPEAGTMREVTVTASRVKFYYKGDTIIYNADAFVLAEGSMLDALISQLPGVELKSDGRIYHNGKFVDDLLLNGKEFFRHDRKLMLENLPAYTVKDIAVYDKQTADNEWLGIKDERTQHHVLDVRLKKEFMVGWLVNVEAGGGTDDRYLARLFAMRHSDFSRLAIVANANNLDDDSKPGESGSWQRGQTNDLRRTERADLDFNASDRNKRWELYGGASVNHQRTEGQTRTVRQNFLSTGDTYDHSYSSRTGEDLHISTGYSFNRNHKNVRWHINPDLKYHRFDHTSDLTSATFNAPVASVSRQLLDDLFSPASSRISLRDTLVNRILRQGQGSGHDWKGSIDAGAIIKIPHSNENLRLGADFNYSERKERLFDRQTVDLNERPMNLPNGRSVSSAAILLQLPTTTSLHHFRDNHPTRDWNVSAMLGYNLPLGPGWRSLWTYYEFNHQDQHHRSTLYLLEQDPSLLPSMTDYHQVMDRSNSYDSRFIENSHQLHINLGYKFNKASYGQIWTLLDGDLYLRQQNLDYQRGSIDTTLARTAFTMKMGNWTYLDLKGGHQIGLTLGIEEKLPDLEQRIDLRDDTAPMNIRLSNTRLRTSVTPVFGIRGTFRKKRSYHALNWEYQRTYNAIAMGYIYDPRTGVRTYRPENVNGNYTTEGSYTFHCNLDSTKKFNLDIPLHVTYNQNVDLVGVESGDAPSPSTVHRLSLSLGPTFKADIGKHHLDFTCQPVWERFTSTRADFTDFHAFTCRTSLAAILKLPWKLDLSTDLTLYSRTGYVDDALNTNDLVWNARLSRPFFKGSLVVMLDGFDILGQLDNVTRTVNGQARTETYTNVMPRYLLAHVVYRFNHQPLKPAEKREKRAARKQRREQRKQKQ
ncbi:MAG: hypothetical protein IJ767_01040 [Bacteroidaceae bacterium]|nr:hypothetical protein [Bacteroidaceae bacterium]